ncbi:MAG: carboxypeptidase regulatory-like domain-containing protein, partial [Pyrinomonadaceae bacterium]
MRPMSAVRLLSVLPAGGQVPCITCPLPQAALTGAMSIQEATMKKLFFSSLVALIVTNLLVFSQTSRGSLTGLIRDQAGAAMVGANVKIKNTATGEDHAALTNAQGAFDFPSLLPGTYQVIVEATGFKRAEINEVVIELSKPTSIDLTMEVGAVTEEITVTSDVQQNINSTSPVLTNIINTRQVQDLPLPSRNPLDLARLQAGIAVTGTDVRGASVGGLRDSATNITQDGINALDNFLKTSSFFAVSAPSLNATSEFSVTVGTVGSDAGRGAAQVNIITPSGTNQFHGNLFYQHRNDALNANSFFNNVTNTGKEKERQHFFGFALNGPVWLPKIYDGHNRSFWFFSYEGFREPLSVTRNRTVLTEQARQGIFRYAGANGNIQPVDLLQIGNAGALNPVTLDLINLTPLPNNTLVGDGLNTAGFRHNISGENKNDNYSIRIDQNLFESERLGSHKLEFVLHHANVFSSPDFLNQADAPFPGGVSNFQSPTRTLLTAAIHSTFGGYATNEVRFGHQRAPIDFLHDSESDRDKPFFINFGSVTDVENRFLSQGRNTLVYQFVDNFSLVKGAHTLRMGNETQSISTISFNDGGIVPVVNLGSNPANSQGIIAAELQNLPRGNAGQDILNRARAVFSDITGFLGTANQTFNVTSPTSGFVPGATQGRELRQRETSFYIEDQWRARQNLTLSFGTRWEFIGVPT